MQHRHSEMHCDQQSVDVRINEMKIATFTAGLILTASSHELRLILEWVEGRLKIGPFVACPRTTSVPPPFLQPLQLQTPKSTTHILDHHRPLHHECQDCCLDYCSARLRKEIDGAIVMPDNVALSIDLFQIKFIPVWIHLQEVYRVRCRGDPLLWD